MKLPQRRMSKANHNKRRKCIGGPWDGETIYTTTKETFVFSLHGWRGRYVFKTEHGFKWEGKYVYEKIQSFKWEEV